MDMFDLVNGLKDTVFGNTKPDGSPEFPARSCKDIQMCFPEADTGDYWLDPNGGSTDDKVKVHCNFTVKGRVETCVEPLSEFEFITMKDFKDNDFTQHKLVAETLEADAKIVYPATRSQWRNLAIGMKSGRQNVTYACLNSPAHSTTAGTTQDYVKLLNKRSQLVGARVVEDSCWLQDGNWHKAVLEYSTSDLSMLPLRDVAVLGSGNRAEQFSVHVGKVCFST